MNIPLTGPQVGPVDPTDLVGAAFRRAAAVEETVNGGGRAAPPVAAVRRRAGLVRGRRRAALAAVSAAVVVPLVVGVAVHRASRPAPPPEPAHRSEPPAGSFLPTADLGDGHWTVVTEPGGSADVRLDAVPMDGCADAAHAFAAYDIPWTGRSRSYRGSTPEGVAWRVTEAVGRIGPDQRVNVLASLRAMSTCRDTAVQVLLGAGSQAVAWGTPRTGPSAGAIGAATAYALVGDTLVRLDTVPGTLDAGPALPGQASWLLDTLGRAARRAGGKDVRVPAPTPAATRAASLYRQLDPGQVAAVPADPDRTGLLTPADLAGAGAAAAMTRVGTSAGRLSLETPIQAQPPDCASGSSSLVYGRGAGVDYTNALAGRFAVNGTTTSGWSVSELRITMDPAQAAKARTALRDVSRCPQGRIVSIPGGMTVEVAGPGRVIGWQQGPHAAMVAEAWIQHGTRLVQLYVSIGSASAVDGARAWSGRQAWFRQIVARAEGRMDG